MAVQLQDAITNIKEVCNRAVKNGGIFNNTDEVKAVIESVQLVEDTLNTVFLDAMKNGKLVTDGTNVQS